MQVSEIQETIKMIDEECLDIRTITMGISLLDCIDPDIDTSCRKCEEKICRLARDLVRTGEEISRTYGIPVVNKRISVTPIAFLVAASGGDPVKYARMLERCAQKLGVDFIGGYSALVQKGYAHGDRELIDSIPRALKETQHVCASVNIGSTKAGINMDAVKRMGEVIREAAELTADDNCIGAAKLVVFCNAPEDNPFMAGAFHGVGEGDCVINVGVSGPGVVRAALAKAPKDAPIDRIADLIKRTAFKITRMGQLVGTVASEKLGVPFGIVDLSLAPTPAVRCVHSRFRGCGDDPRSKGRHPEAGEAGGHDRGVLCGSGHDRDSRRDPGGCHFRHHCRRGSHWHGELEDHRRPADSRHWQEGGGNTGFRRTAGRRPGDAREPDL